VEWNDGLEWPPEERRRRRKKEKARERDEEEGAKTEWPLLFLVCHATKLPLAGGGMWDGW
jgi:hypothetical protein